METTPAARFRAWFEWLGIAQTELGTRLGCDQSTISNVLAGKRKLGLRVAAAVERESSDWPEGPIRSVEWADAPEGQRLAG